MKRREFLKASSVSLVAAGVAPTVFAATPEQTFTGTVIFSRERFTQLINTDFLFYDQNWSLLTLQLIEVQGEKSSGQVDQFSLIFKGPKSKTLSEGMYLVNHYQDGDMQLYLSSATVKGNKCYYTATFALLQ
jgi:hypothetical protein